MEHLVAVAWRPEPGPESDLPSRPDERWGERGTQVRQPRSPVAMPCGWKLRLRDGGRTVAVRVVDRGPFAGKREFDLTAATEEALGFGDVGTVLTSK